MTFSQRLSLAAIGLTVTVTDVVLTTMLSSHDWRFFVCLISAILALFATYLAVSPIPNPPTLPERKSS